MSRPTYQLRAGNTDSFRLYRDADFLGMETFRLHEAAGYYLDSITLEELAFLTFSDLAARAGTETPYVDDPDHGRERFGDGFADGYRRGVSTSTREGLQLRKGLGA
jgi:hypothetical protein